MWMYARLRVQEFGERLMSSSRISDGLSCEALELLLDVYDQQYR